MLGGIFFPQARALGIDVDQPLSPIMQEKVTFIGTLLKSFRQGEVATTKLIEMTIGKKRIERLTERIGDERRQQAQVEVQRCHKLTLTERLAGPADITAPQNVSVSLDGGRYQQNRRNERSRAKRPTHWYEYKAGLCLHLAGRADGLPCSLESPDPIPDVPAFLLNIEQVETLAREIGHMSVSLADDVDDPDADPSDAVSGEDSAVVISVRTDSHSTGSADDVHLDSVSDLSALEEVVAATAAEPPGDHDSLRRLPLSPKVQTRDVVATTGNAWAAGQQLAARAWHLGFFQAEIKSFVADGGPWIWSVFDRHFKPYGFVPIVDFIHAVTYVFPAAMAGRTESEGSLIYRQWVTWLWQGRADQLISALASRQAKLGLPNEDEPATSPKSVVHKSLTYFQNQCSRMDYPRYRRQGMPITSSHMESTIRELNYRLKGTEKFWTESGSESVLHLKADTLCDSDPLSEFWSTRAETRSGFHASVGSHSPESSDV